MAHDPDLIVFDLDGTLVNSLPDVAAAGNSALRRLGLPEQPLEAHKKMIGGGEKNYVRRFLGPDHQDLYDQALTLYVEHYSRHLGDQSRVYAGVTETLALLAPLKKAVLSNKRADFCRQVVEAMGLSGFFQAVRGGDSYGVLKPSPEGLAALIREMGSNPARTFMVGDKPEDVLTGRGAGAHTVALTYGYDDPEALTAASPDFTFNSFSQLAELFSQK
jgi:phosphoglycolate phosphatase